MNNRIVIIAFLAAILISVIGASTYFFIGKEQEKTKRVLLPRVSEASIDTSSWKTYRSEKYGFEFKYPREYDEYERCGIKETDNGVELGEGRFRIEVVNTEGVSLENYVKSFVEREKEELGVVGLSEEELARRNIRIGSEKILIANQEGFRIYLAGRPSSVIFLLRDKQIYQISYSSLGVTGCVEYVQYESFEQMPSLEVSPEEEIFERITSTFKFY